MSHPYKVSKKIFESGPGEHYGVYIVGYDGECAVKIGVTSEPRKRLASISGYSWAKPRMTSFFFPYKASSEFASLPDDYSILRVSAFAFEAACHARFKEAGLHLRLEFFEMFPEEADEAVRKVAEKEGFQLLTPTQILRADIDMDGRADDRLAFIQMANAAGLANEVLMGCKDD